MSPLGATATWFGWLNSSRDALSPATPFLPSDISRRPSGLNLWTTWAAESVTHRNPCPSIVTLWALSNNPSSPNDFTNLPSRANTRKYGAVRTSTTTFPFPSAVIHVVFPPQVDPLGSWAQPESTL